MGVPNWGPNLSGRHDPCVGDVSKPDSDRVCPTAPPPPPTCLRTFLSRSCFCGPGSGPSRGRVGVRPGRPPVPESRGERVPRWVGYSVRGDTEARWGRRHWGREGVGKGSGRGRERAASASTSSSRDRRRNKGTTPVKLPRKEFCARPGSGSRGGTEGVWGSTEGLETGRVPW